MLRNSTTPTALLRHAAALGALALTAATLATTTPAAAAFHMHGGGGFAHGGGFQPHMAMGGGFHDFGHHDFDHHDFDHRFHHRFFGFAGFDYEPGYGYDYSAYDACWRRVWGPYGWRWVNVCY
jgi:hypothetical protein